MNRRNNDEPRTDQPWSRREEYSLGGWQQRRGRTTGVGCTVPVVGRASPMVGESRIPWTRLSHVTGARMNGSQCAFFSLVRRHFSYARARGGGKTGWVGARTREEETRSGEVFTHRRVPRRESHHNRGRDSTDYLTALAVGGMRRTHRGSARESSRECKQAHHALRYARICTCCCCAALRIFFFFFTAVFACVLLPFLPRKGSCRCLESSPVSSFKAKCHYVVFSPCSNHHVYIGCISVHNWHTSATPRHPRESVRALYRRGPHDRWRSLEFARSGTLLFLATIPKGVVCISGSSSPTMCFWKTITLVPNTSRVIAITAAYSSRNTRR